MTFVVVVVFVFSWIEQFRTNCTARPFSRQNSNPLLDFTLRRKINVHFSSSSGQLGKKIHHYFHAIPPSSASTTAPLDIVTTTIYQAGARSKFSFKNLRPGSNVEFHMSPSLWKQPKAKAISFQILTENSDAYTRLVSRSCRDIHQRYLFTRPAFVRLPY